jgi:hypothetical protein
MFRYFADPLCLICTAAYVCNRLLLKPHFHSGFLHGYFNDLLLIPCALPPVLWLQRWLGLRSHDRAPKAAEIGFHLIVWSLLFEVAGPHLFQHAVGDRFDVVAYVAGGVMAWLWWRRRMAVDASACR